MRVIAIAAVLAAVLVGCFVALEQMRPGSDVDLIRVMTNWLQR